MMSEWEKTVDQEIKNWYYEAMVLLPTDKYAKPWQHLFDEERQMYAELFWETKLKDESC